MSVLHRGKGRGHAGMTDMWGHMAHVGMDTEGHTDTDPAYTGAHRHETLGYRHGGTVHIGGCTHRGTHGHGPSICRDMWS